MNDEKIRLLKMVEEGKLTAEQAAGLFEALGDTENQEQEPAIAIEPQNFRIRVIDIKSGQNKINLAIPIKLLKMIEALTPESVKESLRDRGLNFKEIMKAADTNQRGIILEMEDTVSGEKIEIQVE